MQISKYFTLEELTTTQQDADNTPDSQAEANLRQLAVLLDTIYDTIGPFRITSAYRSPSVNKIIGGAENSFHMRGLAADLSPLNDSPENFFLKILRSPSFAAVGELINEAKEKGVVHVSLPTPEKRSVAMWLEGGSYYRYSNDAVAKMKAGDDSEDTDSQGGSLELENVYGTEGSLQMGTVLLLAGAVFIATVVLLRSRRSA